MKAMRTAADKTLELFPQKVSRQSQLRFVGGPIQFQDDITPTSQ